MFDGIFFIQPFRKWFIKLYKYLPEKQKDKLLDKLYPDDLGIEFDELN